MSLTSSRIFFIDALKALAIVLVVMGHTNGLWEVDVDVSAYELVLSPVLAILLCEVCVFTSNLLHKMRLGFVFGR